MTASKSATHDSQFTPSVTYCARRKTAKWAQLSDEARWLGLANGGKRADHYVGIALARTTNGAEEQVRSWAKLLCFDAHANTSRAVTLPWLWAGESSCVATISVTQQGALTAIQVYQHAYNFEYEWPDHLGTDGLRTFLLDALNQFDAEACYSGLPDHILARLENGIRSRTSTLVADVGDTAIGGVGLEAQHPHDHLQSIWRLRSALRKIIADLQEQQPKSTMATAVLTDAVSEIDTLLGVLNTQQLLTQTIADSRARDDQQRRDEEEASRAKLQAENEARHERRLALFATVFIGPSLVFAFFSLPSSPQWGARFLLLLALVSMGIVGLMLWLVSKFRRESAVKPRERNHLGDV